MLKCSICGFEVEDTEGDEIVSLVEQAGDEVTRILCPEHVIEYGSEAIFDTQEGICILKLRVAYQGRE